MFSLNKDHNIEFSRQLLVGRLGAWRYPGMLQLSWVGDNPEEISYQKKFRL